MKGNRVHTRYNRKADPKGRKRLPELLAKYGLELASIQEDTPVRLELAAALAYPDGSVSGRALKRQGLKGLLEIEQVAGKDFTTIANVKRMREASKTRPSISLAQSEHSTARRGEPNAH
jgi:hypothetical protein